MFHPRRMLRFAVLIGAINFINSDTLSTPNLLLSKCGDSLRVGRPHLMTHTETFSNVGAATGRGVDASTGTRIVCDLSGVVEGLVVFWGVANSGHGSIV